MRFTECRLSRVAGLGAWAFASWRSVIAVAVALLPLGLWAPSAAAASGWSVQPTPNPAGNTSVTLTGVSCTSGSACTAVGWWEQPGSHGTVVPLAEGWNGMNWSIEHMPNPTPGRLFYVNGVSCTSASACTAVGDYNPTGRKIVTLAERWNGTKWSIQHTPNPTVGASDLNGVSCASASACTAVGAHRGSVSVLVERWNGTKWSIEHTPKQRRHFQGELYGVSCALASACTAVGNRGDGAKRGLVPLVERWNGTRWSTQPTPKMTPGLFNYLFGVSCPSTSACTAVGRDAHGTLAERWNGTKWSIQPTPHATGPLYLTGVSCASAHACTAVGFEHTTSTALAERWDGTRWSTEHTPEPTGGSAASLNGVSCASAGACTTVGFYSTSKNPGLTLAERWNGIR
jgi:hypothetical protein